MDDIEKLIKDAQLQVEQEEKFKEEQRIYEEEKAKEAELIRQAEEIYVLPASPVIPIIHSSEYTDIESTTTHAWFTNLNSNGYNTLNPNGESQKSISTPFILEVKKSFKLSPSTTRFLFGVSLTNSIQVTGQVSNTNYFFTENHFYKLENNEIPIDLGTSLPVNKIDPQEALDRTVAVVKKVNEKVETKASGSLKATNDGTDLVDISSMTGTSDRTVLTTEHYVDNKVLLATQDMTGVINTKLEGKADKAFESIKDISSATTQAEVYALLEVGKTYNWHGSIIRCFDKQPSQAMVRGFGVTNTNEFAMIGIWVHNTADPFTITVPADLDRLSVYTPSGDNHATNKKYVDDKVALKQDALTKTITLHFDDNTTEDIKVG